VLKKEDWMNLLNSLRDNKERAEHWVELGACRRNDEHEALRQFNQKLDMVLNDLGRIDYQLGNALSQLHCDLAADTSDALQSRVAQQVEPGLRRAVAPLVAEITRAKCLSLEVTDESAESGDVRRLS
jgi:hypothetical protein